MKNLKILLWKMESTYDTDPVPSAATDVLNAENVDINPLEMETDEYKPVSASFGSFEKIVGGTWCTVSFDVLLCGGGTPIGSASKVPNYDGVLRACGMARTVAAGVNVQYSNIDTGEESGAMYFYMDGVLQKMTGLRGTWELSYETMKAVRLNFKGIGLNKPMTDSPITGVNAVQPVVPRPVAMNKANTVLSIGGYAARLSSFSISQNNDVKYRNNTGREDVTIVDRNMTGKVSVELPLIAEKDFLGANGICTLGTPSAMSVVHGTQAGNIVTTALASVQLLKPKPKVENGVIMLDCELHIVRNQCTLTFT